MKNDPVFQAIRHVIDYFGFFSYPPSLDDIHRFLSVRISRRDLVKKLDEMVKKKDLVAQEKDEVRYCRYEMINFFDLFRKRVAISEEKIKKAFLYIGLLRFFPWITFVGISGSVAMQNAKQKDDIDLFIITAARRLWTGRLCAALLAFVMGIKRNRKDANVTNKICLNLFFDENHLGIPLSKQNEYVGHEILQVKPIVNKNSTYELFLYKNGWFTSFFPNMRLPNRPKRVLSPVLFPFLGDIVEAAARWLQLLLIKRHQTRELISDEQLWFFPKDFENHIRKHIMIEKKNYKDSKK